MNELFNSKKRKSKKDKKIVPNLPDNILDIEIYNNDYLICSGTKFKYLVFLENLSNVITDYIPFEEYIHIGTNLYILKRNNELAVFYFDSSIPGYKVTDFKYKSYTNTTALVLVSSTGSKDLFFNHTIFKNIVSYEVYGLLDLIKISYNNLDILYGENSYGKNTFEEILRAKKISFLYKDNFDIFFSYTLEDDTCCSYIGVNEYHISDFSNCIKFKHVSIHNPNNNRYGMCTDLNNKKHIFNVNDPEQISPAYTDISLHQDLFIGNLGNTYEIFNSNYEVILSFESEAKISFLYSSHKNEYIVSDNSQNTLYSIKDLNDKSSTCYYSIYNYLNNTKSLYCSNNGFFMKDFVKTLDLEDFLVFRFNSYFILSLNDNIYYMLNKKFNLNDLKSDDYNIISSPKLISIIYYDSVLDKWTNLDGTYIELLRRFNVSKVNNISKGNGLLTISATISTNSYPNFINVNIVGNELTLHGHGRFQSDITINTDEVKTTLLEYLCTSPRFNSLEKALFKYYLD